MRLEQKRWPFLVILAVLFSAFPLRVSEVFGEEAWRSYNPLTDPNYGAQASVDLARVEQFAAQFRAAAPWMRKTADSGAIGGAVMPLPAADQQPARVEPPAEAGAAYVLAIPSSPWYASSVGVGYGWYGSPGFYGFPPFHPYSVWGWRGWPERRHAIWHH